MTSDSVDTLPPRAGVQHADAALDGKLAEFEFLIGRLIDREALADALFGAADAGLPPQLAIVSSGRLSSEDYVAALARKLAVPMVGHEAVRSLRLRPSLSSAHPIDAMLDGEDGTLLVLDGTARRPTDLAQIGTALSAHGVAFGLTTPEVLRRAVIAGRGHAILREAVSGLRRRFPGSSAATGMAIWQATALAGMVGLAVGAAMVVPSATQLAIGALLSVPFLFIVVLRLLALWHGALGPATAPPRRRRSAAGLPVYSVLVPLFDETRVLPGLIGALRQLDYPVAKLDIKLILESVDTATIEAVARMRLGPPFEVVIVPDRLPRTKPKALNYALQLARGDFVVIYDAEDLPEPRQLKDALAAFDAEPVSLGCVQGRLAIDNAQASWLASQFAIEYLALFDGLLPAFERMRLPIPLGGTSNHFRTKVLRDLGGWDAFNVTEDADLGIRLARNGHRCRMIAGRTYEEAPVRFMGWLRQRTRWLKGWMQTYSVHMRSPGRLLSDLGLWRFAGFHAVLGGLVLSALVQPVFYLAVLAELVAGSAGLPAHTILGATIQSIAIINLIAGYGAAMLLGLFCVLRRRQWRLVPHVLLMPVYWLLISVAAYRAVYQLVRDPFGWEKTDHGVSFRSGRLGRTATSAPVRRDRGC